MRNKINKYLDYKSIAVILVLSVIITTVFFTETNAQVRRGVVVRVDHGPARVIHGPRNYTSVVVGGRKYFYNGGSFYKRYRGGYNFIAAPIGARIRVLPEGFVNMRIGAMNYYYFNGAYYTYLPDQAVYVVVEKPAGANNIQNLKLDQVKMNDGTTIEGVFQSATDSTVTFKVGDQNRDMNISDIISITFAPTINEKSESK